MDFDKLESYEKIIVYGAGIAGKQLLQWFYLRGLPQSKVVVYDKNFEKVNESFGFIVVEPIFTRYASSSTCVIIALNNEDISNEIKEQFASTGYDCIISHKEIDYSATSINMIFTHVENFTENRATGWAWVPVKEESRVIVSLLDAQKRIIVEKCADEFRSDLLDSGIGDGCYGFNISISEPVSEVLFQSEGTPDYVLPYIVENRIDVRFVTINNYEIKGIVFVPKAYNKMPIVNAHGQNNELLSSSTAIINNEGIDLNRAAYDFRFVGKLNGSRGIRKVVFQCEGCTQLIIPIDYGKTELDESLYIHNDDYIYKFIEQGTYILELAIYRYIQGGMECADKLRKLCDLYYDDSKNLTLLEFASGYGRVTRSIDKSRFNITACDIHEKAIKHIENSINVRTQLSSINPDGFILQRNYDVVFALSFFSHIPEVTFGKWIRALYKHVSPGGLFIFTTHGRISNKLLKLITENGYAFQPTSEQGDLDTASYWTTITEYSFVEKICMESIDKSPDAWIEALWWDHQDIYVIRKPLTPT